MEEYVEQNKRGNNKLNNHMSDLLGVQQWVEGGMLSSVHMLNTAEEKGERGRMES